ncbi:hypothetical protein [Bifidobacterium aerophilum]|uniref:RelA/SpoT domain-containing protein n=1 Tax=Bifidobacterium aerophilum TaxID=1798155 RepID=A0A6N9Z5B6_9BIFI|nr:hypothetical protein [Bifidobacterium aerophilum]NEG89798.1 hypothetical protein [Bifidobacterium aerophilum]
MDDVFDIPAKPWTGSTIKAMRDEIVRGGDSVPGLDYATVYAWYSQVLVNLVERLNAIDYTTLIGGQPDISFRVKTVDTLRDKLIRQDSTPLFRVHDIIGARITADMTLSQQNQVVDAVGALFPNHQVSDMREHPHSGYRAVHVIVRLPRGIFAEVQVRTMLQDAWANCYEAMGDRYGRLIRYGGYPESRNVKDLVVTMQQLSNAAMTLEEHPDDRWMAQVAELIVSLLRSSADYYRTLDPRQLDRFRALSDDAIKLIGQRREAADGGHGDPVQPEDGRQDRP